MFCATFTWRPFIPPSPDYVFVTPVEVNSDGGFLSHDVTGRSHRTRRSLSSSVHYRLSAFGRDMQLDLHPSPVVGPGFTVQSLGSEGITTVTDDAGFHHCLYQGFIRNLSSSSAALSTCSGLVSARISLSTSVLWISCFCLNVDTFSARADVVVHVTASCVCVLRRDGSWFAKPTAPAVLTIMGGLAASVFVSVSFSVTSTCCTGQRSSHQSGPAVIHLDVLRDETAVNGRICHTSKMPSQRSRNWV